MWIRFFAALATALLAGLGTGSAGLLVVFFSVAEKLPQIEAQGLNLTFFLFASGASLLVHLFRTPVLWRALLFLLPAGAVGVFLGGKLAFFLPRELLRRLFGALLMLTGAIGLFKGRENKSHR